MSKAGKKKTSPYSGKQLVCNVVLTGDENREIIDGGMIDISDSNDDINISEPNYSDDEDQEHLSLSQVDVEDMQIMMKSTEKTSCRSQMLILGDNTNIHLIDDNDHIVDKNKSSIQLVENMPSFHDQ